jgi:hypothetical protein
MMIFCTELVTLTYCLATRMGEGRWMVEIVEIAMWTVDVGLA